MTSTPGVRAQTSARAHGVADARRIDLTTLAVRQAGAVWGFLVGNATGVPYASAPAEQLEPIRFGASGGLGAAAGTWSDDGALMLAMLDSLLSVGFDPEDQAKRIYAWYSDGIYTPNHGGRFDVDARTRDAIHAFERGTPAERCGATEGTSERASDRAPGSGAPARLLPIALVEWSAPDELLVEHARRAARVTNGTIGAQIASACQALLVRGLLTGEIDRTRVRGDALAQLRASADVQPDRGALLSAVGALEAPRQRHGGDSAGESLWSAWDAFAGAPSFWGAIERAIRYGNRTATTAALAGGFAGAYWGLTGIPNACLVGMRGDSIAGPLVARLLSPGSARVPPPAPIHVDWVGLAVVPDLREVPGRLGLTSLPGQDPDGHSALHWRDLEADAGRLRRVESVDTLWLLALDHELLPVRRPGFTDVLGRNGIEVLQTAMPDMDVPPNRGEFQAVLDLVRDRLRAGRSVAIACRGGHGRSGTVVACLLRETGLDVEAAMALTRDSARSAIDSPFQEAFVRGWTARNEER